MNWSVTVSELRRDELRESHCLEAFNRRDEPTDLSIAMLLNDLVPLSKLISEQIGELRKWAKGRARRAKALEAKRPERKIAA